MFAHLRQRSLHVLALLGISMLVAACAKDHRDKAMDTLTAAGYTFSVEDFFRAAAADDSDAVAAFLKAGMAADVRRDSGLTALAVAAEHGATEAARSLLEGGANPTLTTESGRTALMAASISGSPALIRLLMEHGADARARDHQKWHALTLSVWYGQEEAADVLAAQAPAADIDDALLFAALRGDVEMTDMLLRRGGSVMARDAEDRTPLMLAAMGGHSKVVSLLLENGANRYALAGENRLTAAQIAATAAEEARVKQESDLEANCREAATLLAASPSADEAAGIFADPRPLIPVGDAPMDPESAQAVAQGKARPAEKLDGSSLPPGDFPSLARRWKYAEYRESPMPFLLDTVSPNGKSVRIRRLYGDHAVIQVPVGQSIPGTTWRVTAAEHQMGERKGLGTPVEISTATLIPPGAHTGRLMVAGEEAQADTPVAVLHEAQDGSLLMAREGDTFRLGEAGPLCRVISVTPEQLVLEEQDSQETLNLPRR